MLHISRVTLPKAQSAHNSVAVHATQAIRSKLRKEERTQACSRQQDTKLISSWQLSAPSLKRIVFQPLCSLQYTNTWLLGLQHFEPREHQQRLSWCDTGCPQSCGYMQQIKDLPMPKPTARSAQRSLLGLGHTLVSRISVSSGSLWHQA